MELADVDYALSRVLFPQYRHCYINGVVPMLRRGEKLFDRDERGHPDSFFRDFGPQFIVKADDLRQAGIGTNSHPASGVADVYVVPVAMPTNGLNTSNEERTQR